MPQKSLQSLASTWQDVVSTPVIRSGTISGGTVHIVTESHDVQSNKKVFKEHHVSGSTASPFPSVIDGSFVRVLSPSGTKCVTFQVVEDKRCEINIMEGGGAKRLSTAYLPVRDATFQHFSWSEDETVVVYTGEKKRSEVKHPWDVPPGDAVESDRSQWETKDSWGEAHEGSIGFTVALLSLSDCTVVDILGLEFQKGWSAVEPLVVGDHVMFTAISHFPRKLGLVYCRNRPGTAFLVPLAGELHTPKPIPSLTQFRTVANARLRNGNIVFFAPSKDGYAGNYPHNCCFSLHCVAAADVLACTPHCTINTLVSIPPIGSTGFHGLYPAMGNELWFLTPTTLLVGSIHRSSYLVYEVNINATNQIPKVLEYAPTSCVSLLDVRDGIVAMCKSSLTHGTSLLIHQNGVTSTSQSFSPPETTFTTELIGCPDLHDSEILFHSVGATQDKPTILQLHGGPHSTDVGSFAYLPYFWLACGYNIASVNYGGSTGFGQDRIVELMGKVGTNDVNDCIGCLDVLKQRLDLSRVVVAGGSHGGFLAAHLTGQFPTAFKAALIRNPVINIASIYYESDIPDWAVACTGVEEKEIDLNKMMAMSPIVHASKVVTPTFLGIGCGDLRVPPPQGKSWYHHVRANPHNCPIRMVEYPNNGHPLDGVHAAADFAIRGTYFAEEALIGCTAD